MQPLKQVLPIITQESIFLSYCLLKSKNILWQAFHVEFLTTFLIKRKIAEIIVDKTDNYINFTVVSFLLNCTL